MKKNPRTLETIQRRASKSVKGMKHLPYEDRLKKLKVIKIEEWAIKRDLIEAYKIMTGKLRVDWNNSESKSVSLLQLLDPLALKFRDKGWALSLTMLDL